MHSYLHLTNLVLSVLQYVLQCVLQECVTVSDAEHISLSTSHEPGWATWRKSCCRSLDWCARRWASTPAEKRWGEMVLWEHRSNRRIVFWEHKIRKNCAMGKSCKWTKKLHMGWLRLVGSLKLQVSFAKEPCKRDDILQKRRMVWRNLLIIANA